MNVDTLCTVYQLNQSEQFWMILNKQDNGLWVRRKKRSAAMIIRWVLEVIKLLRQKVDCWECAEGGFQLIFNVLVPLHRLHTLPKRLSMSRSREYVGNYFLGFSLMLLMLEHLIFELGNPYLWAHKYEEKRLGPRMYCSRHLPEKAVHYLTDSNSEQLCFLHFYMQIQNDEVIRSYSTAWTKSTWKLKNSLLSAD